MKLTKTLFIAEIFCCVAMALGLNAQVTPADYDRAAGLREKYKGLALHVPDSPVWIRGTHEFWYRRTVEGGHEFIKVDADKPEKSRAFDHERLASVLSEASGEKYTAITLPIQRFRFDATGKSIEFRIENAPWSCNITEYKCAKQPAPREQWARFHYGNSDGTAEDEIQEPRTLASPDGRWIAWIENYNVFVRSASDAKSFPLSFDGSEGNYYEFNSLRWSPDSARIVAYRVRPGYRRIVRYIESSPKDRLQPRYPFIEYQKPGDVLDLSQPVLFEVATRKQINIDNSQFPNPYQISQAAWWKDGRAFTFEYNQRGHQVYRIIEVDAMTGAARGLISEESKTFIDYPLLTKNQNDSGRIYRYDVKDGSEIIWMSERDGWAHLYLFDGKTGKLKNQITKGNWVVRGVDWVDEEKRQIWFEAGGMNPGKDPYFLHGYVINFDGTGLRSLTNVDDANHDITYSSDGKFFVDIFSRVDAAPKAVLKKAEDGSVVMELESANIQKLVAAGWKAPEVFTAIGRDGKTDIWGLIYRPANFDPKKKYPVIEGIYAGPQGSFVPKSFSANVEPFTELGFVVVRIDGMGTNNRSKAFHDVAWKNLKDGGFKDRILWHKAAAAKYPWYDVSRVGLFGNSAGGQNALAGLLFHPEFYKAAVASSGSHDNRMDKIWWNELWMGWPIGPHYAESSNVDNAYRLQGKLLLIAGEMDNNVDPSTTWQVVNALIKANKVFELLYVPGGGHGSGGAYGQRLMGDFFVRSLLGQNPPDWNRLVTNEREP